MSEASAGRGRVGGAAHSRGLIMTPSASLQERPSVAHHMHGMETGDACHV